MSNDALKNAINEAFDSLMSMDTDEFNAALADHRDGEFASMLVEANAFVDGNRYYQNEGKYSCNLMYQRPFIQSASINKDFIQKIVTNKSFYKTFIDLSVSIEHYHLYESQISFNIETNRTYAIEDDGMDYKWAA
ncbi:hypothetical protein [Pseudodesulfovibrio senegalensis]|uniref:Uncharacterized protein n=1 Tax=Pseudodesulfovibrio senegalensis TaxID=1721087 RepID=A0A6N6N8A8_9BACT|nr:hypothetical protein [Pseudodesulfovibrio senegalensis]KAB1443575.1 hypothetical protein F8A88_04840 [Pseudodesulfovibrio senegalensis]